ncbi:MAG: class I SAM-dependent methyltransferase [Hyphomicrobiales bacterium]|nr:class I SAM-dependent methyltransferase [Hyphomicrobiales bacterium]
MTDREDKAEKLLEGAYRLRTPGDNVSYYRTFAADYDGVFISDMGYIYPKAVAECYGRRAAETDVPVADIGCGTGAVAEALDPLPAIDGFDISPEMIAVARAKNIYREFHEVDLTAGLDHLPNGYGAVLSAGTFTHGHLGPEALEGLLRLGRPGALFCIGINSEHFEKHGFARLFDRLVETDMISVPEFETVRIYEAEDGEHASDTAQIVVFRLR